MMKTLLAILFVALGLPLSACAQSKATAIDEWAFFGNGFVAEVGDARLVSEYPGSKGVMLVSPDKFDCGVTIRFDVLPLNPESVLVTMLASSDAGPSATLLLPDDYDGSIVHLMNNVDAYFFAFHNAAHKRAPFVRRHPFVRGESSDLAAATANVMSTQWHEVETSVGNDGLLRLIIDGNKILETRDASPLNGGHVVLRLRGTSTHVASALFRDVTVSSCDSD